MGVLRRLSRRKRASVLLLLGVIFVINGYVLYDTADTLGRAPTARLAYAAHLDVAGIRVWAWLFIVIGATSAVAGWFHRLPAWLGFAGLQGLSAAWGLLFVASYAQNGYGRSWLGFLQWAAVAGVLAIIAGWEDPPADVKAVDRAIAELGGTNP